MERDVSNTQKKLERTPGNDLLWMFKQKQLIAVFLLSALVALLVPEDVLRQHSWLATSVNAFEAVIPMGANFAVHSKFPELSRFYGALMLLCVPIWVWTWFRWPDLELLQQRNVARMRENWWVVLATVLCVALMAAGWIVGVFLVEFRQFNVTPIQTSKLALAIYGPIHYGLAVAAPLVAIPACIRTVILFLRDS
jgi:uncharacterized membrane protein YidH (DUF202 family)